jgi:hypothetical protein
MLALLQDGADHYYTAEQALAEKLIDAISEDAEPAAMAAARMVAPTRYSDLPAAWLQADSSKPAAAAAAAPSVAAATQTQETEMPKIYRSVLATALLMAAAGTEGSPAGTGSGGQPAAPGAGTTPAPDAAAQAEAVRAAERDRQATIRNQAKPFLAMAGVSELVDQLCAKTVTPEAAAAQILTHVGQSATPVGAGRIETVQDEADKIRGAQVNVLLARAGVRAADGKVIAVAGNPFRGHTLLDLAKASLQRAGVRIDGMDKMQIVGMAFTQTTSDFPVLLENTMHKTLQAAYATQALTWRRWARQGTVSDFRAHPRYRKGSFGVLDAVGQVGGIQDEGHPGR